MLRIVGALMIFFASTAIGITVAEIWRKGTVQLEAFHRLVVHTARQIEGFLYPLDKIFAEYEDKVLEQCGFLDALRHHGPDNSMEACKGRLYISEADISVIKAFFSEVGRHTAHEEARLLAYYEKKLGELASKSRSELQSRVRLSRGFGMLIGIMMAVILL